MKRYKVFANFPDHPRKEASFEDGYPNEAIANLIGKDLVRTHSMFLFKTKQAGQGYNSLEEYKKDCYYTLEEVE